MSFFKSKSDARSDSDFYDRFEFGTGRKAKQKKAVKPDPDFYDVFEFETNHKANSWDDWMDD